MYKSTINNMNSLNQCLEFLKVFFSRFSNFIS